MGQSLEQLLANAVTGSQVGVAVVTNQDNGVVTYASGSLIYYPGSVVGQFYRFPRLSTTGGAPLTQYFSNRRIPLDPPSGGFVADARQPFSANDTEKLGLSIGLGPGARSLKFTVLSSNNVTFTVSTSAMGNELVGLGPPVGPNVDHAVYVVSFTGISAPPR